MRVRGNWISLVGWRAFAKASDEIDQTQGRLSSGIRVRSAKDDAPGLSIGQNMLGQVKGLMQASRNALDGISLLNTAEGALHEVNSILQRLRELALQASNGTLTREDRTHVQTEATQLLREIDRISESTSFNGRTILNPSGTSGAAATVMEGLRSGWLEQAEQIINTHYGLAGDGSTIQIRLVNGDPRDVWVSGTTGANWRLDNLTLNINLEMFEGGSTSDGGAPPFYSDRRIARALTHAMLARNSEYADAAFATWLKSGLGDYIAGGDEFVEAALSSGYSYADITNAVDSPWADDSLHRAAGYLAVKWLDDQLPMPISFFISQLQSNTVEDAFLNSYGDTIANFISAFKADGPAWAAGLPLFDSDVGSIGGGTAESVIPTGSYSPTPLSSLAVAWPTATNSKSDFTLQVGANQGETLTISIPEVTRFSLGLIGIDLVNRPDEALPVFSTALDTVTTIRSYLGSMHNRLEHAVSGNDVKAELELGGYSRIVDADMANELTKLTRGQILVASSSAVMAQANTMRQHVMWLLKDLPFSPQKPAMLWS